MSRTYLDPKFLDDDENQRNDRIRKREDLDKPRKRNKDVDNSSPKTHKHHHSLKSSRKPKIHEEPICDIWTIIPLTLAALLFFLSFVLYYQKNHPAPFCSSDISSESKQQPFDKDGQCLPCPQDAICRNGKMECNYGFKLSGHVCVTDTELDLKAMKLAISIGKYVSLKVNEFCNASEPTQYDELSALFGGDPLFAEALSRVTNTDYDIQFVNGNLISFKPSLNAKCKVYRFVIDNQTTFALICGAAIISLVIIIGIKRKINMRNAVKSYALKIVEELKKDPKNEMHPMEEFEPLENNSLFKRWEEIVDLVEADQCVEVFNSTKGKMWRFNHSAISDAISYGSS